MVGRIAQEHLGALRALEPQVGVVVPGEADAAVDLDRVYRRLHIRIRRARLGQRGQRRQIGIVLGGRRGGGSRRPTWPARHRPACRPACASSTGTRRWRGRTAPAGWRSRAPTAAASRRRRPSRSPGTPRPASSSARTAPRRRPPRPAAPPRPQRNSSRACLRVGSITFSARRVSPGASPGTVKNDSPSSPSSRLRPPRRSDRRCGRRARSS